MPKTKSDVCSVIPTATNPHPPWWHAESTGIAASAQPSDGPVFRRISSPTGYLSVMHYRVNLGCQPIGATDYCIYPYTMNGAGERRST